MFGGGFGGGGLGGLGMGPMMGSSGFNGYQVPFGAPPPFHPITGIPNFVGIGGTSNLPGNHVPPMFPPSNVNHQCHPNTDHAPYSARGGRDRGRGHYGFRGGRGAADFQGQGRYGQNGSYNYHNNFNYNHNQQAAAQPEHMKGFDTTPIRFENGQAPMVEIYDGSAAVISTGNKIESVRADEGGDGLGLGAEADASAEAAGEEVAADKTEGDDSESDADSLIIKLDGDAEDRIQGDNQSGWQGHPQADVQMPLHNDHRYPSFNRQSSFQSTNSSFPDHSGHYTGFQHPNGINDERIQTSNRSHNDSYREHGFANGHNVPIQPHAYAPVLAPPHFQSQHGRKSTINGSASAHTVPALRDNGPQTIPVRRAMGTGVEGAPKGPKAMRESAAVNPSLQINVHKTRLPYGAARGTRSTPEDQIEAGRAPRQESDYRYANI